MPDRYGFNLLGQKVFCIECDQGGYMWDWGEKSRAKHHLKHQRQRDAEIARKRKEALVVARQARQLKGEAS